MEYIHPRRVRRFGWLAEWLIPVRMFLKSAPLRPAAPCLRAMIAALAFNARLSATMGGK